MMNEENESSATKANSPLTPQQDNRIFESIPVRPAPWPKTESGSPMSKERALNMFRTANQWLYDKLAEGASCRCGNCYLCAYRFFAAAPPDTPVVAREGIRAAAEAVGEYLQAPPSMWDTIERLITQRLGSPVVAATRATEELLRENFLLSDITADEFNEVAAIITRYLVGTPSASFIEAFRNTAIKYHGALAELVRLKPRLHDGPLEHQGPWEECDWIECEDRRKMIAELEAATPSPETLVGGEALEPCPFCGGSAERRLTDGPKRGFIGCFTCMIGLPFNAPYGDAEIAAWNSRTFAATPLCKVHRSLDERDDLVLEIGNDCVACSLHERTELLTILEPFANPDGTQDSVTVLRNALTLSSRDTEIREVLEGLSSLLNIPNGEPQRCWCKHVPTWVHTPACLAARRLCEKVNLTEPTK